MEKTSTAVCLLFLAFPLFAQQKICPDTEGSQDYPGITRYDGSCIIGYHEDNYASYDLVLGRERSTPSGRVATASKSLEGKIYKILYGLTEDRSSLEVFRNYDDALKRANFNQIFRCKESQCGDQRLFADQVIYKLGTRLKNKGNLSEYALSPAKVVHYAAYHGTRDTLDIYVSLLVAKSGSSVGELEDRPVVLIDVIETRMMESGLITVDEVESSMENDGFARFYGILFDFDSDMIQESSYEELDVMATYLREHPDQKVYIVGHTDGVGSIDYNLELSKRRSSAVIKALIDKFDISPDQIDSYGVGPLAPVGHNRTDLSRHKNRRVEMVLR